MLYNVRSLFNKLFIVKCQIDVGTFIKSNTYFKYKSLYELSLSVRNYPTAGSPAQR